MGGRQLTLYLKVAITGQASCTGRRMVGAPGRTSTPGRPAKPGQRAPWSSPQSSAQEKPRLCGGAFLRCSLCLAVGRGVQTARPCEIVPPNQAIPHRQGSLLHSKSVRPVQCGSQVIAQKHQGPQGLRVLRALALLRGDGNASAAVSWGLASASIIAPGREGSQAGRRRAVLSCRTSRRGKSRSGSSD